MMCPVCEAPAGAPFLVRERVPVHQNLLVATEAAALAVTRGRLELVACETCGFVFNAAFDAALLRYGADYDNTQSHSPAFRAHVKDRVARLDVRDSRVVEVGCGKGDFLRAVVASDAGNRGWGFDPSYVGEPTALDGRVHFRRELYGPAAAQTAADLVICRHVIEHLGDPMALLHTIRAALTDATRARVVFETPAVDWILDHGVRWDCFYEHCSLFTAASLTTAFQRAGFDVRDVTRVFGDQYLWLEAGVASRPPALVCDPQRVSELARDFAAAEAAWIADWRTRLAGIDGGVAVWGAGAKGVTFVNLVDPDRTLIDCVVDINPHKQGKYLPGTGHPIIAPDELRHRRVASAVLVNPMYRDECEQLLRAAGLSVALLA